jgi:hypothetical protein
MPIPDMLTHFPRLPLTIDCFSKGGNIDAVVEEGITLALEQRNRVC